MTLDVTAQTGGLTVGDDLGQGLGHGGWRRPVVVEVDGGDLRWELRGPHQRMADVLLGRRDLLAPSDAAGRRGMLGGFLRLRSSDAVASFARRWGVLVPSMSPGRHDGAGSEPLALWWGLRDDLEALVRWAAKGDDEALPGPFALVEPVEDWAPLMAAQRIDPERGGGTRWSADGAPVHWVGLRPRDGGPDVSGLLAPRGGEQTVGDGRVLAGLYVEALLAASRPVLTYDARHGVVTHVPGLAPALALQVAGVLDRSGSHDMLAPAVATCSGCSEAYTAARKPREGEMSWCQRCRDDGAPARERQKRHRARRRAG